MSDPIEKQTREMHEAIGFCLMAWANVEFQLQFLFRVALGGNPVTAHEIWSSPRAFEARLNILNVAVKNCARKEEASNDWALLRNYTISLSKLRNQIAHATLISENGEKIVLEPYLIVTRPNRTIERLEVLRRADLFLELSGSINWLQHEKVGPHSPPLQAKLAKLAWQEPDLVLRLRNEDAQRRKVQREKHSPSAE
jgi:hypothetical protein